VKLRIWRRNCAGNEDWVKFEDVWKKYLDWLNEEVGVDASKAAGARNRWTHELVLGKWIEKRLNSRKNEVKPVQIRPGPKLIKFWVKEDQIREEADREFEEESLGKKSEKPEPSAAPQPQKPWELAQKVSEVSQPPEVAEKEVWKCGNQELWNQAFRNLGMRIPDVGEEVDREEYMKAYEERLRLEAEIEKEAKKPWEMAQKKSVIEKRKAELKAEAAEEAEFNRERRKKFAEIAKLPEAQRMEEMKRLSRQDGRELAAFLKTVVSEETDPEKQKLREKMEDFIADVEEFVEREEEIPEDDEIPPKKE
jgi:transcription initiation factor TFIIIB Brf1 subunit/transcription initiation factor TFIIB